VREKSNCRAASSIMSSFDMSRSDWQYRVFAADVTQLVTRGGNLITLSIGEWRPSPRTNFLRPTDRLTDQHRAMEMDSIVQHLPIAKHRPSCCCW